MRRQKIITKRIFELKVGDIFIMWFQERKVISIKKGLLRYNTLDKNGWIGRQDQTLYSASQMKVEIVKK